MKGIVFGSNVANSNDEGRHDVTPMRGQLKGWLIPTLLLGTMAYALAEDVTLTTYYPSPRGVYKELQVTELVLNPPGNLQVPGSLAVGPTASLGNAGDVSVQGTVLITNADLDAAGIGPGEYVLAFIAFNANDERIGQYFGNLLRIGAAQPGFSEVPTYRRTLLEGSDLKAVWDLGNTGPVTATVTVYLKGPEGERVPVIATAAWDGFYPISEKQTFMWRRMPYHMLAKVAEALALRKAFPIQFAGVYAPEEIGTFDDGIAPVQTKAMPVSSGEPKALPAPAADDKAKAMKALHAEANRLGLHVGLLHEFLHKKEGVTSITLLPADRLRAWTRTLASYQKGSPDHGKLMDKLSAGQKVPA